MNKFRILGVIAIIAIIANFFGGLDENWRDFKKDLKMDITVQWKYMSLDATLYPIMQPQSN